MRTGGWRFAVAFRFMIYLAVVITNPCRWSLTSEHRKICKKTQVSVALSVTSKPPGKASVYDFESGASRHDAFHKLPNGSYGLLEWYPNAKEAKSAKGSAKQQTEAASAATEELPTDEEIINAPTTELTEVLAGGLPKKAK